jgi:bacteriocin biosynthesis cyclodehydratase domain-containing protein
VRLKRHWSVIAHGPDDVELRHGVWNPISISLADGSKSGLLFRLLSRLTEATSPEQLAREENVLLEEVQRLIDHLLELGAVETKPGSALDYYLEHVVPWRADEAQSPPRVILLGDDDLAGEIRRYLPESLPAHCITQVDPGGAANEVLCDPDPSWVLDGIQFEARCEVFDSWRGSFVVVANKLMNPVKLRVWNRIAVAHRIPWLHAAIDGPFVMVGPIVVPLRSPCYECLETRVTMNLRESASYQKYKTALVNRSVNAGAMPLEPALGGILASHTALEAINFCLTGSSFTVGKLLAVHLPTMEFTFNEILRAPTCAACGPVAGRDDAELYFDTATLLNR